MTSQYSDLCIKVNPERLPELRRLLSTQFAADDYFFDAPRPMSSRSIDHAPGEDWFDSHKQSEANAAIVPNDRWFTDMKTQLVIQSDFIRCLLDMNNDAILICAADSSVESCNQAALDLLQIEHHDLLGRHCFGFFSDQADMERFRQLLSIHGTIAAEKLKINRVFRIRNAAGRTLHVEVWVEQHYQLHRSCYVVMMKDCSQRMRVELELRTNIAIHRTIAEAASDAIVSIDQYGIVQYCNPALLRLFQMSRFDVIDFSIEKILPSFKADLQKMLVGLDGEQEVEIRDFECVAVTATGQGLSVALSVGGISADFPLGLSIIIRDISIRKKTEEALQSAKQAAEAASQAKSLFLANMSHEIRTPLNAIVGFMELIMEQLEDNPSTASYAESIRRNTRLLLQIINDILDLSKVEAGKLEFSDGACSLTKIISNVRNLFADRTASNGVSFRVIHEGPVPDLIETDEVRLEQILINLVGNAVKFTSEGFIELKVAAQPSSSGSMLTFTVTDSGRGITPEAQKTLFQPFSQGDIAKTRAYGGTGLGLLLSRKLVEGLGGFLQLVSSQPGQGSCFRFAIRYRLPAASSAADTETQTPNTVFRFDRAAKPLRGLHFLVVDDAPDNHALLSHLIQGYGGDVIVAENGRQAVERAAAKRFDFIFMDLQMPEMDGFQATEIIRQSGYRGFIFAFSAATMKEDRSRSLEAGCDEHLAKPIDVSLLLRQIHERMHLLDQRWA